MPWPQPILPVMDDFRSQLITVIDTIRAGGAEPVFLLVDLEGIEYIKKVDGQESLDKFRAAAIDAITGAAAGCDAFTYGEDRLVAILAGYDRLKTFALIEKLRRALPLLSQSFDCFLRPEFDVLEYDPVLGIGPLIAQLAGSRQRHVDAA